MAASRISSEMAENRNFPKDKEWHIFFTGVNIWDKSIFLNKNTMVHLEEKKNSTEIENRFCFLKNEFSATTLLRLFYFLLILKSFLIRLYALHCRAKSSLTQFKWIVVSSTFNKGLSYPHSINIILKRKYLLWLFGCAAGKH